MSRSVACCSHLIYWLCHVCFIYFVWKFPLIHLIHYNSNFVEISIFVFWKYIQILTLFHYIFPLHRLAAILRFRNCHDGCAIVIPNKKNSFPHYSCTTAMAITVGQLSWQLRNYNIHYSCATVMAIMVAQLSWQVSNCNTHYSCATVMTIMVKQL